MAGIISLTNRPEIFSQIPSGFQEHLKSSKAAISLTFGFLRYFNIIRIYKVYNSKLFLGPSFRVHKFNFGIRKITWI